LAQPLQLCSALCVHLQVRLLVAAAGLQLLALTRVRVGGWVMPRTLKQGAYM
jgi:16S rRNA U516 pseudouridylate synthase RsuA-like enzyme